MSDTRDLLRRTADHSADFLEALGERPVYPDVSVEELREALGGPLPEAPADAATVVDELVSSADPGVVATPSGRYFGFVIGGAVPAALAADWLTSTWDQNAGLYVGGPSASVVEEETNSLAAIGPVSSISSPATGSQKVTPSPSASYSTAVSRAGGWWSSDISAASR